MRPIVHALAGLTILIAPCAAAAQSEIPPPIVQSLEGPETQSNYSPWLGAVAGASVAIIGLNAFTAGALLAPTVGPTLSGLLGGAWLGVAAVPAPSAQAIFETTTLVASGVTAGIFGYWVGDH